MTEIQQNEVFKNLNTTEKIRLWKSKISQVLSQKLTSKQRLLTKKIYNEISNLSDENYDGDKLLSLAVEMAKITPKEEFIVMFSKFEDYHKNDSKYESFDNSVIVNDLISFKNSVKIKNLIVRKQMQKTIASKALPACNCRWTCGFYNYTDKCSETERGCGFLGIQGCTGRV